MTNLHFIRIKGKTPEDAEENALKEIEDWGDEDNWRQVIGSFNKGTRISHINEDDKSKFKLTAGNIKKMITNEMNIKLPSDKDILDAFHKSKNIYYIKEILDTLYANSFTATPSNFDIWENNYRDYQFDKVGITNMLYTYVPPIINNKDIYCVAIDIHS